MENKFFQSIHSTKEKFEKAFAEQSFYDKQTQDEEHKNRILDCLSTIKPMRVLDLGTGSGYLAFAMANQYPDSEIIGLDIVEEQLKRNRMKAHKEEVHNLQFVSYQGMKFPFEDNFFDLVVSRYALHHFPNIQYTFSQISRVLKEDGRLFLSDPTPNKDDKDRFVDAYMKMKQDGHIKFYTRQEWIQYASDVTMYLENEFETSIRFPKMKETATNIEYIMSQYDKKVIEGYRLEFRGDEIYITEQVNNMLFRKKKRPNG